MWAHRRPCGGLCRVGGSKTRNFRVPLPRPLSKPLKRVARWTPSSPPAPQGAPRSPDSYFEPVFLRRAGPEVHLGWKRAGVGGRPAPWGPGGSKLSASLHADLPPQHGESWAALWSQQLPPEGHMAEREGGPGRTGRGGELLGQGWRVGARLRALTQPLQGLPLIGAEARPSFLGLPAPLSPPWWWDSCTSSPDSPLHPTFPGSKIWTHLPCPWGAVWEQGGFWASCTSRGRNGASLGFSSTRDTWQLSVARPEHRTLSSDRWGWVLGARGSAQSGSCPESPLCEGQGRS